MIHQPELGSATALLTSDSQGSVIYRHSLQVPGARYYTAFGFDSAASHLACFLGFTGALRDRAGYYMLGNGYRAYNAKMMRFNSPDGLSPFGIGGLNSYAYGNNDPVNTVDHSGHAPKRIIKPTTKPTVKPITNSLPNRTIEEWTKHQQSGWPSLLSDERLLSTVQQYLPSRDVSTLASISPKAGLTVIRYSNKLANARITGANILEVNDALSSGTFNMNGITLDSASTRADAVTLAILSARYDSDGNPRRERSPRVSTSDHNPLSREDSLDRLEQNNQHVRRGD